MLKFHKVSSWWFQPIWTMSQIGSFPQIGVNRKNLWNHHLGDRSPLQALSGITNANILGPCFLVKISKQSTVSCWHKKNIMKSRESTNIKLKRIYVLAKNRVSVFRMHMGGFTPQRQRENFQQYGYGWFNIRLVLWDRKIWILISSCVLLMLQKSLDHHLRWS